MFQKSFNILFILLFFVVVVVQKFDFLGLGIILSILLQKTLHCLGSASHISQVILGRVGHSFS